MGFETQLIFNNIEVPRKFLRPLQASARDVLLQSDCPWAYMLNYIYVESSECDIIDLQISKGLKKKLTKQHGGVPLTLEKMLGKVGASDDKEDSDDPWYTLAWDPYDGGDSGKWCDTDKFVAWLSPFCTSGQLFQVTQEDGGGLWGWAFQEGMFCELELKFKGRWRKPRASKTAEPSDAPKTSESSCQSD
jgi:hypothetical protein